MIDMSHNDLRNVVAKWMSAKGYLVMFNNAVVGRALTDDRIIKANGDGRADIQAIAPKNGRYWAIEVKTGSDRLKPKQKVFKEQVEKRGGVFVEARSLHDVMMRHDIETSLFN